MLRAVRFAARLGFDDRAGDGRRRSATQRRGDPRGIAAERIGDEIVKHPHRGRRAPRLRARSTRPGCCGHVLPEIAAMQGVEQSPDFHPEGDVFTHTLIAARRARSLADATRRRWRSAPCCTTSPSPTAPAGRTGRSRSTATASVGAAMARGDLPAPAALECGLRAGVLVRKTTCAWCTRRRCGSAR